MKDGSTLRVVLVVATLLLSVSCIQPLRRGYPYANEAPVAEEIARTGEPLSPREILADPASFEGRTILVDGYLGMICERIGPKGCERRRGVERFVIFGERDRPPANELRQPCMSNGNAELLLAEYLSVALGVPDGQRVLIKGVIVHRPETLPAVDHSGSDVRLEESFDYVLTDVAVLSVYGTRCSFYR